MHPAHADYGSITSTSDTSSSQTENTDMVLNILLIGDSGVGKTALARAYTSDPHPSNEFPDVTHFQRCVNYFGYPIRVHIWDAENFDTLNSFRTSSSSMLQGVVLVFAMERSSSLAHVQDWLPRLDEYIRLGIPKFLVGTTMYKIKQDLNADKVEPFSCTSSTPLYLTSPVHNRGVEEAFEDIVTELVILKHREENFKNHVEEIGCLSRIRVVYGRLLNWIRSLIGHVDCWNTRREDIAYSVRNTNYGDSDPYQD